MYLNKKMTNLLLMNRELHGSIGDQSLRALPAKLALSGDT